MNLDEYQEKAKSYDFFAATDDFTSVALLAKVLGLVGESGETADKIKKILRDKNGIASTEDIKAIEKELGDVLWYVATIARYLKIPLSRVAKTNLDKLSSRKSRGKLHGSGDER